MLTLIKKGTKLSIYSKYSDEKNMFTSFYIPFIRNVLFFKNAFLYKGIRCYRFSSPVSETRNLPRLKLRGLPFDASEEEIKNFFQNFQLSKEYNPVHIIKGMKNNPTGQAYVYFDDEEEARNACKSLNRKFMRDRYIEIYTDYIVNHNLTPVKTHVTRLMRDRYRKDNQ